MNPIGFRTDSNWIPQDFLASRGRAYPQPVPNPYPLPTAIPDPIVVAGALAWVEAFTESVLDRARAPRRHSRTTIDRGWS
jgi:hypothetical protein